jgi:hypothetical protein
MVKRIIEHIKRFLGHGKKKCSCCGKEECACEPRRPAKKAAKKKGKSKRR